MTRVAGGTRIATPDLCGEPATLSQLTPAPASAAANRAVPGSAIFAPSASLETVTGGRPAASYSHVNGINPRIAPNPAG